MLRDRTSLGTFPAAAMILFFCLLLGGATKNRVAVHVQDKSGAPFPNVLVIIRSLDHPEEIGRFLTNREGDAPPLELAEGLYRVIATCPYGLCKTKIHELLVGEMTARVVLSVDVVSTDEHGEVVGASSHRVVIVDESGRPAEKAELLVRDPEAHHEKWYVVDALGKASIELPSDPAVVIVVYKGNVFEFLVSSSCSRKSCVSSKTDKPIGFVLGKSSN